MASRLRFLVPWHFIACLLFALLPLILLANIDAKFYWDWQNHLWHISYFAEFFKQHGSFPVSLNTDPVIGMMYPPFYGVIFFPALALLANLTGAPVAIRIFCVAVTLLQFAYVYALVYRLNRSRSSALIIATLVSWAIYPLTNLYNRSALTEFGATLILTSSICAWFFVIIADKLATKVTHLFVCAFLYTLACLSHPITALYGAVTLILIMLMTVSELGERPRLEKIRLSLAAIAAFVLSAVAISPWAYVTNKFVSKLYINSRLYAKNLEYYDFIDNFLTRFSPFPVDPRSLAKGMDVTTPYLDAQLNLPLLILLGGAIYAFFRFPEARRRSTSATTLVVGSIGLFLLCLLWSVKEGKVLAPMPLIRYLQLAYRFITYENVFLLTALVGVFKILDVKSPKVQDFLKVFYAIGLTLAGGALVGKLLHGHMYSTQHKEKYGYEMEDKAALLKLSDNFYGYADYISPFHLQQTTEQEEEKARRITLLLLSGPSFGISPETKFSVDQDIWVQTSVSTFPWNRIVLDGKELPNSEMRDMDGFIAIRMTEGVHSVQFKQTPDPIWLRLREISFWTIILWATGLLNWIVIGLLVPVRTHRQSDLNLAVNAPV